MHDASLFGSIILLLAGLITYKGLRDHAYLEAHAFKVDPILVGREYYRLLTSGFLHVNWIHFAFNMFALLSFSTSLEIIFGRWNLFLLYFASLIGGNLLALYIHRNHGDYSAVGASGAVSGVILASTVITPNAQIGFFLIPIAFKQWVFALLFVLISIYGIKSQRDNIGHEAHLGGGIVGVLLAPLLVPDNLMIHWWVVALILVPSFIFLFLVVRDPAVLLIQNYWGAEMYQVKDVFKKKDKGPGRQTEIDLLLDKIRQDGYQSLTQKEKDRLEQLKDEM